MLLTRTPEAAAAAAVAEVAGTAEIIVTLDLMVADEAVDEDEAEDMAEAAVADEATGSTARANRNNRILTYPIATMRTMSGRQ